MNTIVDRISGVVGALTAAASINRFIKSTEERLKSSNQMSRRSYEMLDWEIHQILGAGPCRPYIEKGKQSGTRRC